MEILGKKCMLRNYQSRLCKGSIVVPEGVDEHGFFACRVIEGHWLFGKPHMHRCGSYFPSDVGYWVPGSNLIEYNEIKHAARIERMKNKGH
jgi:hypothetical protein